MLELHWVTHFLLKPRNARPPGPWPMEHERPRAGRLTLRHDGRGFDERSAEPDEGALGFERSCYTKVTGAPLHRGQASTTGEETIRS